MRTDCLLLFIKMKMLCSEAFYVGWYSNVNTVDMLNMTVYIPGGDHILAQLLKWCSASRIKPNETFELAKKRQKKSLLECAGGRTSLGYRRVTSKVLKTVKNLFVLQFWSWDGSTWWDENMTLFVFSACYQIHWNWFCGRNQTKNAKIRKGAFFREGCFDRKEYISNTANKRCSRQVLQLRCSSSYSIKFYT